MRYRWLRNTGSACTVPNLLVVRSVYNVVIDAMEINRKLLLIVCCAAYLMIPSGACAEESRPVLPLATGPEVIQVVQVNRAPVIDGVLDDGCWSVASKVTGFAYRGRLPRQQTTAYFCCDSEKLYLAFDCKDTEPSKIVAQQKKRGGKLWDDDYVEIGLDCMHDHRTFFWFMVNPLGTQDESIPGGSASKVEWKGDWRAVSKINDDGWTAEIEVPFSILRYPKGQSTFGLSFSRRVQRLQEGYDYPNMGDKWIADNMIDWVGLVTPTIKRSFVYMPYTMTRIGEGGRFTSGLDIKRTFDNNVVTALTIHPDFETIEQAVDSVDFSYNPRYLEDHRPFFTEGSGYFGDNKMLYSRLVDVIDIGGKVFGKVGPHKFGVLAFADMGSFNSEYLTYRYEPGNRWSATAELMNYHGLGKDGRVGKLELYSRDQDAGWSRGTVYYRSFDRAGPGEGFMWDMWYDRWQRPGRLGYSFGRLESSPEFSSPIGYVNDLGTRFIWANLDYYNQFESGWLYRWNWHIGAGRTEKYGGAPYGDYVDGDISLSLRNNTRFAVWRHIGHRMPYKNDTWSVGFSWRSNDMYRSGGLGCNWGEQAGADYSFISFTQGFKLTDRLSAQISGERLGMDYPPGSSESDISRNQVSASLVYDITNERGLGLGFRHREGKTNLFCTYRQEVRRGTDIFVLLGDPNSLSTESRLSFKLVRVL